MGNGRRSCSVARLVDNVPVYAAYTRDQLQVGERGQGDS